MEMTPWPIIYIQPQSHSLADAELIAKFVEDKWPANGTMAMQTIRTNADITAQFYSVQDKPHVCFTDYHSQPIEKIKAIASAGYVTRIIVVVQGFPERTRKYFTSGFGQPIKHFKIMDPGFNDLGILD